MALQSILEIFVSLFAKLLFAYFLLLVIRVLLSWFPNVSWMDQPFLTLSQLTDPYLNLFRRFIPPLGGIDFSPIVGFLLLQVVMDWLNRMTLMLQYY